MEQKPKSIRPAATQDFVQLQDLLYLCLRKWQWILLSLVVSMGFAIISLRRNRKGKGETGLGGELSAAVNE